jgi:two-component system phosphate regulon sensor histidine kinase PhoR
VARNLPFSPKLRIAVLWPALAALLVLAVVLASSLPRLVSESAANELLQAGKLLTPALRGVVESGPAADLQARVVEFARPSRVRLTLIARDGTVLADSTPPTAGIGSMDNHAARPEIAAALRDGQGVAVRHSDTKGESYAYAAWTLTLVRGEVIVVRLAQPVRALGALRRELRRTLLGAAALAALVVGVVWWWLARSLFQPLSNLIAGANELAKGTKTARLEVPKEEELSTLAKAVNRLADRADEQLRSAQTERDQLHGILSSMVEGVLVTSPQGTAEFVNPEFRRQFGLEEASVSGRSPLELSRQPRLAALVAETLRAGTTGHADLEVDRASRGASGGSGSSGASRSLSLSSSRLGNGRGVVVVARDVTGALRLDAVRRDFVANVSHELKTPLAAIRAYAETLRDGALDERETAVRFVGRVLEQCRRLEALLSDLLTLSRLEAPGERAAFAPVDLAALARRAIELSAAAPREPRLEIRLHVEAPGDGTLMILGDGDGLQRMIGNLLDNAIAYNRPGGTVDLTLRGGGEGEGKGAEESAAVEVEVRDTGVGIAPEALPRIFERFYRVDRARSRAAGGTGLGLAIVKHVAQAHGGTVEVESEVGKGSVFRVRLPRRAETGAALGSGPDKPA